MLHSLANTHLRGLFHVRLVDRIADNKHVIDTDTDQEEGHQAVHSSSLASKKETQTKA